MKKIELASSHETLTAACRTHPTESTNGRDALISRDGLRTTNLNEHITFGKKLSEQMKGRAVFDIEADINKDKLGVFDIQIGNYPKCLNKGLTMGQLSAFMPAVSHDQMFPKTNFHLHMVFEAMRRGQKLVFTCQETDHDYEAELASMGYPK